MSAIAATSRIRWRWVVLPLAIGAALLGLAGWLESNWQWQGVSTSILVNAGVALALAGLLIILGQVVIVLVEASEQRMEERTSRVEERLETATRDLSARIDDLAEGTAQRVSDTVERQQAAVDHLNDEVRFDTVARALAAANETRSLANGVLTVEASEQQPPLRLQFMWGMHRGDERFNEPPGPALDVEVDLDHLGSPRPVISVTWRAQDHPIDVGARIVDALKREGCWEGDETLRWDLALQHLVEALNVAIHSRNRVQGHWHLHGGLYEVVDDDWALTEAGIEHRERGVVIPEDAFPDRLEAMAAGGFDPPRPEFVSPEDWEHLVRRGRTLFPRNHMIGFLVEPSWYPLAVPPEDA